MTEHQITVSEAGRAMFEDSDRRWARFFGAPHDPPEGSREFIFFEDLSHTEFVCAELGDGTYVHYLRRGDGSERAFDYAGLCSELPDMEHAHPGPDHGHD